MRRRVVVGASFTQNGLCNANEIYAIDFFVVQYKFAIVITRTQNLHHLR